MMLEREIAMRIESAIDSIMDDYEEDNVRWVDADWYPEGGAAVMVKVEEGK